MKHRIKARLSEPDYGELEERYVAECLGSRQVTAGGTFEHRLEARLAEHLDVPVERIVAVSSGSAALHLALLAAGVGRDDEVVIPGSTYIAPAAVAAQVGAMPVIVPVCGQTGLLTPELLDEALDARKRSSGRAPAAVIAVDFVGRPVDGPGLADVCEHYGSFLVEDACEALGASHGGTPAGAWGDISVFSFNGTKVTAGGAGGAIRTSDTATADHLRKLSNQGRNRGPRFDHEEFGFNYRISNLHAAVATAQMERLPDLLHGRRQVAQFYREALSQAGRPLYFLGHREGSEPSEWLPVICLSSSDERNEALERIRRAGYEARPLFSPLHRLRPLRDAIVVGDTRPAEELGERGLLLPSSSTMDRDAVLEVAFAVMGETPQSRDTPVNCRRGSGQ